MAVKQPTGLTSREQLEQEPEFMGTVVTPMQIENYTPGTDIYVALKAGRNVRLSSSNVILDIYDDQGNHYDNFGNHLYNEADQNQESPATETKPEEILILPDDEILNDITIPLDGLIKSSGTIIAPIKAGDPSIAPGSGPKLGAPELALGPMTTEQYEAILKALNQPQLKPSNLTPEQWAALDKSPNAWLKFLDEITGFSEMIKLKGDESLMAWIAIMPLGIVTESKGIWALYKAITARKFISFANKQSMQALLAPAIYEAEQIADDVLLSKLRLIESKIWSGGYTTLKEFQPIVDDAAKHIVDEFSVCRPVIENALTKAATPESIKSALKAKPTPGQIAEWFKVPPPDATLISTKSYKGIKGLSTSTALRAYISKLPPKETIKKAWATLKVPIGIAAGYFSSTVFALFILEETQQTYGFAAKNVKDEDAQELKKILAQQAKSLNAKNIAYIPVYGPIWAFYEFFKASYANIKSHNDKKIDDEIKKQNEDKIKNTMVLPGEVTTQVLQVIDGDTLEAYILKHRFSVRIVGINTTEKGELYKKEGQYWLQHKIGGRNVTIKIDPAHQRDKYNRVLGTVYLDGEDIGKAAIRAGWAAVDIIDENKYTDERAYQEAQDLAKAEGRGIWQTGKSLTITEIKRRYINGIIDKNSATIAMDNLLISDDGKAGYFELWDAEIAKKKPVTPVKPAPSPAPSPVTPTPSPAPSPGTPAPSPAPVPAIQSGQTETPIVPPVAPELPKYDRNTGDTIENAKSKREIQVWSMIKSEQIAVLKNRLRYLGTIPRYEKDRVRLIINLEMDLLEGVRKEGDIAPAQPSMGEVTPSGPAPATPSPATAPVMPTAQPNLTDLKREQAMLQRQLNQDKIVLGALQSKALRLQLNYKQNWRAMKDLNAQIAEIEKRIAENTARLEKINYQIRTYKSAPEAPILPSAVQATSAIPSTGQLLGTQPVVPDTNQPVSKEGMSEREKELWDWNLDQLKQKLITLGMTVENIEKLNKSEQIQNIMRIEGSAPAAAPVAPTEKTQLTGYLPANGATDVPVLTQLSWPIMDDVIDYQVYFGASTVGWQPVSTGIVPSILKSGLRNNTKYYWAVYAKGQTKTVVSPVMTFTTVQSAEAAPPAVFPAPPPPAGTTQITPADKDKYKDDPYILHLLESGFILTLDPWGHVDFIFDPSTGKTYKGNGDLVV